MLLSPRFTILPCHSTPLFPPQTTFSSPPLYSTTNPRSGIPTSSTPSLRPIPNLPFFSSGHPRRRDLKHALRSCNTRSSPSGELSKSIHAPSCRGLGATYAKGWLIMVGASRTSPMPGNRMRRRHARRRILPSFRALRGDNTPTAALRGLRMITMAK